MTKLPTKPHPILNAFTESLLIKNRSGSTTTTQSSNLQKTLKVLSWRNRFSQAEYYPVELELYLPTNSDSNSNENDNANANAKEYSKVKFQVKQVQRGEVENTYGTGATVWPASMVLLKYMEHISHDKLWNSRKNHRNGNTKQPFNIGDLGAGTGVTSIAAAMLFDHSFIICTDGCDPVVDLARDNVKSVMEENASSRANANEESHEESHEDACQSLIDYESEGYRIGKSNVQVCKYWWGDGSILKQLEDCKGSAAVFDIILVSGESLTARAHHVHV